MLKEMSEHFTQSPILALIGAYIGGVLTSFTPCVYPVIPITAAYIGARSSGSKLQGFLLSLSYVTGIALTYAVLGLFAASTGRIFGTLSANPWVLFVVGNILIMLSLSMVGLFTIPVPAIFRSVKTTQKGGHWGAFLMGIPAGFVTAPCTAPVLGAILTFVAKGQNVILGFASLFLFGFGLGTLLILIGTFSGLLSSLPKPGIWMERVKKGFGWFMFCVGEYFLIQCGKYLF
ncbi:MAG: cytochrome c biogenesis protein CcdA [Chlamydiota bacterium]|nr:cytochrome c biogenesis protein CcdA [Chlamydiota bacterium]